MKKERSRAPFGSGDPYEYGFSNYDVAGRSEHPADAQLFGTVYYDLAATISSWHARRLCRRAPQSRDSKVRAPACANATPPTP
jgi:hypothetical protein